ncbi:MAG: hypothetical protein VB017_08025 [Endomicrobiaceae bacterium]|jgi:uncharacterized protein YoxC|nr:hypothetical protein [Endomicrobiaceae bacterium]
MNEIIIICIVLLTVSVVAAAVYFIITMIQIAKTAKQAEEVLSKMNSEMDKVEMMSDAVTKIFNFIPGSLINIAASVMSLFFKNKK